MKIMNRLNEKSKAEKFFSIVLTLLLVAFLGLVFYINLSCNPEYYDGDIYADITYAKEAWKAKSLFPENWIFGNQTYVVATPVLAALFYGITGDGFIAMAIASCIMTVLVVLTYDWMTRTLFSYNERMGGFLFMVGIILIKDHIAIGVRGAQLFFTMASYYACYIITAFIVYGCYIRFRQNKFEKRHIIMAIVGIALSFATGMQSLRQTAIMALPLVLCELLEIIADSVRNKRLIISRSTFFSIAVLVANIIGHFFMKSIDIEQNTIYGTTKFTLNLGIKELISECITAFCGEVVKILQSPQSPYIINLIVPIVSLLIIIVGFVINVIKQIRKKDTEEYDLTVELLLLFGCASVFVISVFSSLNTRDVYYFMIFPLLAHSVATILKFFKKGSMVFISIIVLTVFAICTYKCYLTVNEIRKETDPSGEAYKIADYITDNGYDTMYYLTGFIWRNYPTGEDVIAASGDKIYPIRMNSVIFWEDTPIPEYLRIKDEYKTRDDEKSIYLFNKKDLAEAKAYCKKNGINITVIAEFENRVLCKFSKNLFVYSEEKVK